jgi:hypothetical protein
MNELSIIFDKMGIDTTEVLEAAGTKWNFLKFKPGLVGGHCIGVDPYYLTHKAEMLGYHPQVILAGRRINDGMGKFIAEQTIKHMIAGGSYIKGAKVNVLGLTFKENCGDLRNSKVIDIINELKTYGVEVFVTDPQAEAEEAMHEYGVPAAAWDDLPRADAIVAAVAHQEFAALSLEDLGKKLVKGGAFIDVKAAFDASAIQAGRLQAVAAVKCEAWTCSAENGWMAPGRPLVCPCRAPLRHRRPRKRRRQPDQPHAGEAYRHAVVALTEVTDFRHRISATTSSSSRCTSRRARASGNTPAAPPVPRLRPASCTPATWPRSNAGAGLGGARARARARRTRARCGKTSTAATALQRVRRLLPARLCTTTWRCRATWPSYLVAQGRQSAARITQIYNGVDTTRFSTRRSIERAADGGLPVRPGRHWLVGTVGRMQRSRTRTLLARPLCTRWSLRPAAPRLRLVMVGDGPLRAQGTGCARRLPGGRSGLAARRARRRGRCHARPELFRAAVAGRRHLQYHSGSHGQRLPVVATDVGGNADLVDHGQTGDIVAAADVEAMARRWCRWRATRRAPRPWAGRPAACRRRFSLQAMVAAYQAVYDRNCAGRGSIRND